MIEAIKGRGNVNLALCRCDRCAAEVSIQALHQPHTGGKSGPGLRLKEPGEVNRRLISRGWRVGSKNILCPTCAGKNDGKTNCEEAMAGNVTELRQPTPAQRRAINEALGLFYDIEQARYRAGETDKTVAEQIGGGIMPGWVAEIREAFYGADGGNVDIDELLAELRIWCGDIDQKAADIAARHQALVADIRALNDVKVIAGGYLKRIEVIKAAVGPKAARA